MPYSQQQLENALRKANAAGDQEAARAITGELRKLKGGVAPRAETAPSSPSSFLGDVGGGAWAATKGAAKGALGDVVGLGQIGEYAFPGTAAGLKAIPAVGAAARGLKDWTRSPDPNYPTMGELGRLAGAAAPIAAAMPLTGLGALADAAAFGGLTGFVQPTAGGNWREDAPARAREAGLGALYGLGTGLGGLALRGLAPLAGAFSRYGPPYWLGGLFGHPWLGMHFGGKTAAAQAAGEGTKALFEGAGKMMTPAETTPPWLNVRGARQVPPSVAAAKGLPERMPKFARKNQVTAPSGTYAPAAAGAEAEQPQAGDPNDPLGYLRYGEQ